MSDEQSEFECIFERSFLYFFFVQAAWLLKILL